jgi:anoctamin-10/anoctamin-7
LVSAVVTNAALIVFTMDLLNHYSTYRKFWIFIGFQWVMFTGQYVLATLVDDVPQQVEIQLQRADFINRKIIMREADETDRVSRHSIHIGWNVDEHISSDINEAIKELESQSTGQSTI